MTGGVRRESASAVGGTYASLSSDDPGCTLCSDLVEESGVIVRYTLSNSVAASALTLISSQSMSQESGSSGAGPSERQLADLRRSVGDSAYIPCRGATEAGDWSAEADPPWSAIVSL